ncbi:hypothetical protein KUCAC02_036497 [Chaenocephalus aceratus]|nr:hypothetical protein KUCAC02_036497 [Chaenocephalus aceratus]
MERSLGIDALHQSQATATTRVNRSRRPKSSMHPQVVPSYLTCSAMGFLSREGRVKAMTLESSDVFNQRLQNRIEAIWSRLHDAARWMLINAELLMGGRVLRTTWRVHLNV